MKSLTLLAFALLALALLTCSCLAADEQQSINVIAVNYPPYTSPKLADYGSTFSLLNKYAQIHFRVAISPSFLPPARAHRVIKNGAWCLSLYPPAEENTASRFVALSNDVVSLGFYRLQKTGVFRWQSLNELSGKIVALLRTSAVGQMHQRFLDAGLTLVYVESVEQGLNLVLKERVDYAFGDNLALSESLLSAAQRQKLQFSESKVYQAKIGFFYNIDCEAHLYQVK